MAKGKRRERIYCANCIHCKTVIVLTDDSHYMKRIRCLAGKWRKKLGEEKIYKYFTVSRRSFTECDSYESMGDNKNFLRELKKDLPLKDEVYELN